MDQNTHPTADHDFTEQELRTATLIAQAAAAKFRPSYHTPNFQPHFWVVAGIATLIRELGEMNTLSRAVVELESLDQQIKALVVTADVPAEPSPEHFVAWVQTLAEVRGLIDVRTALIADTEASTGTAAPENTKHLFCGLRNVLDLLFTQLARNGYSTGSPLTDEQFRALTASVDFRSIFGGMKSPEQHRAEATAAAMQQSLQERFGPNVNVTVDVVPVDSDDEFKALIDAINNQVEAQKEAKGQEGDGNGSIH